VRWIRHMSRPIRPWSDFVAFLRIVRILREERPNIVHTHTAKAGTLGRLAATLLGIPVVHSYHGHVLQGYFGRLQTRIWLAIERALNKVTAQTLTVSESQANELVDQYRIVPRQKLCVVRDGYDLTSYDWEADGQLRRQLRRMFGFDDSHFVALWAGRLVPIKNVELLAQIIREAERWPSLRFLIVGDGTDRRKLETLTAGCSNAHIAGWRSDMPKLWAAADVGLLTSRNEGTPTALIEAMAAGKPFVSTKVGGVIDLAVPPIRLDTRSRVERAANGFLTPLVSNPMLNCLNFLARHPAEARSMGKVGHSFALTQHSDKRLQAEIERLYFDLLGSAHLAKRRELRRPNKQSA